MTSNAMNWKATSFGILSAAAVLLLLGVARMLVAQVEVPGLELREVVLAEDPPPPPPPPPEEEPPPEPPPVALTEVEALPDPLRVPVAKAEVPIDVTLPVECVFTDTAPAPLPVADEPPPRRRPRPAAPAPKPQPKPVAKSSYSIGELDGKPRLLRHPSVSFPSDLARRGVNRGTVVLEVELSQRGSVSVRRVISASHPELVAKARQVAAGSRFTPPMRRGQPVKAVMRWPITIQR
jgi:protein TonB